MKKKLIIIFLVILLVSVICIINNKCRTIQKYDAQYLKRESKELDDISPKIEVSYSNKNKTKDNVVVTLTSDEEIAKVTNGEEFFDSDITYTTNYYDAVSNEQYNIMPYVLIIPSSANESDNNIPLIVWLHGDGEVGGSKDNFLGKTNDTLFPRVVNDSELEKFNAYILCPHAQESVWWKNAKNGLNNLSKLLDYIVEKLGNVDTTKITIMGHSGGAAGATYIAANMDELSYKFTKLVLMSSGDVGFNVEENITIPTRGYYGTSEDQYYISYMNGKYNNIPPWR